MILHKIFTFFLLLTLWTSFSAHGLEVYIDADIKSDSPSGGSDDPFQNLTQAWNKIQDSLASDEIHKEEIVIYLKPNKIAYAHPEGVNISNKAGENKIESLTIKSWDDLSLDLNNNSTTQDCGKLPKLGGSENDWTFSNIPNVTLRGLSFTSDRKIYISNANDLEVKDVCLSSSTKDYIRATTAIILTNIQRPVFKGMIMDLDGYVNLVNFTNEDPITGSSRIKMKDILVFVSSVSTYSTFYGSCFEFRIRDYQTPKFLTKPRTMNWKSSQEINVKNVYLKFSRKDGVSKYLPLIGSFTGFDSVNIENFSIEGQYFYVERMTPFKIYDTVLVNITETFFKNNFFVIEGQKVPSASRLSLYTIGNAQNVTLRNISLTENRFIMNKFYMNTQPAFFQVAILDGVLDFTLQDVDIKFNTFAGDVNLVQVTSQEFTQVDLITVKNLKISNTTVDAFRTFSFLTVSGNWLKNFTLEDVTAQDNSLFGKLFRFDGLQEEKSNNTLYFNNVGIDNCTSRDFGLMNFSAKSTDKDPLPQLQYYYIKIEGFTVMNNNFTGYGIQETSFIEIQNAKTYIEDALIIQNTFDHHHTIMLRGPYSSIFMMSCLVDFNTFSQASFVKTKFDLPPVILQSAICQPSEGIINPFYRFGFINFVNFTNLVLKNTALLSLTTPYLNVGYNIFENMTVDHARILEAGDYDPATCGMKDFTFKRNEEVEKQVLEEVDFRFYLVFDRSFADQMFSPVSIVYSYMIFHNHFKLINLTTGNLITLKKYDFQQGSVSFLANNITGLFCYDSAVNLVESIGSIQALGFVQNTVQLSINVNSLLKFSEFKDNQMLVILLNQVSSLAAYSCFIVSGSTLNNTRIILNTIERSRFFHSIFDIDVTQSNGIQTWSDNKLHDNILTASDRSLIDIQDPEGKTMLPVNPLKISKSVSSMLLINIERNEGNIHFHNTEMIGNRIEVSDQSLYAKLSYFLVTIEASKTSKEFVMYEFKFINNTYRNVKDFAFHKELNGLFSILVGNSKCIISYSHFKNITIDSQGNSLFFIASNNTSIKDTEFSDINMYKHNAILDLTSLGVTINQNKFTNIKLAGVGAMILNPTSVKEGELYAVSVQFEENYFKNCKVPPENIGGDMGNILTMKHMYIVMRANRNTIVDSFDKNPAFYFSFTNCPNCEFKENSFEITSESSTENRFYEVFQSIGKYQILNNVIKYEVIDRDHSDLFFVSRKSGAEVMIDNLQHTKKSSRVALRLAQMDSGILKLFNIEIKNAVYTKDQYVLQVWGDQKNLFPALVSMQNVTLENLWFTPPLEELDEDSGMIDFKSTAKKDTAHDWHLLIQNCNFKDIVDNSAIAIRAPELGHFALSDTKFTNLKSTRGPAVNFLATKGNSSIIMIVKCHFIDNHAYQAGGAIFMNPANYTFFNNTFANNHAETLGGAIFFSLQESHSYLSNVSIFQNNTALVGNDVVSSIKGLILSFDVDQHDGIRVEKESKEGFETKFILRNASTHAILSTSLTVNFYDYNGFPTLDLNDNSNSYTSLYFGKATQKKLTSKNCDESGCFLDHLNMILSGEKNEIITVQVEYSSVSRLGVKSVWETSFDIELRACVNGEHFNNITLTCDYCPAGTYSLDPSSPCQDCPVNATCRGGNSFEPKPGFWKSGLGVASIVECRKDGMERCIGGEENDGCAIGFTGAKCEACDFQNGFVQSGPFNCKKCESPMKRLIFGLAGLLVYVIYKAVCVGKLCSASQAYSDEEKDEKKLYEASEKGYYVKLLMIYTQILSLLVLFNMEMKGKLAAFLQIGNPSEFLEVNLQCSLMALGISSDNFIKDSILIILASPAIQIILIIILCSIFMRGLKMSRLIWLSLIFTLLLEQPGIVGNLTSFLSCSHDKIHGDYLLLYPNWSCQDPTYLFYKELIITPALIFWGAILPVFVFLALLLKRNKLEEMSTRGTWGIFYDSNNKRHRYWSIFVMIFAMTVSYITYNFQADVKACAFTLFLLLCGYQFLTRLVQPYRYPSFNFIEGLVFNLLMITVILGYYTLDNHQPTLKIIAYGIIGVMNSLMFVFLMFKVFDLVDKKRLNNVTTKLKRVFGGGEREIDEDGLKEKLLLSEEKSTFYGDRNDSMALEELRDQKLAYYVGVKNNDDVIL